jgi:hypothetical protein
MSIMRPPGRVDYTVSLNEIEIEAGDIYINGSLQARFNTGTLENSIHFSCGRCCLYNFRNFFSERELFLDSLQRFHGDYNLRVCEFVLYGEVDSFGLDVCYDDLFGTRNFAHGCAKQSNRTRSEYEDCTSRFQIGTSRGMYGYS